MSALSDQSEKLAVQRFWIMNGVRIGSILLLFMGLAIARAVIDLPYAVGVILAVVGLLAFYFAPRWLARKWKSPATNPAGDDAT